jgi:hypothetical protein
VFWENSWICPAPMVQVGRVPTIMKSEIALFGYSVVRVLV